MKKEFLWLTLCLVVGCTKSLNEKALPPHEDLQLLQIERASAYASLRPDFSLQFKRDFEKKDVKKYPFFFCAWESETHKDLSSFCIKEQAIKAKVTWAEDSPIVTVHAPINLQEGQNYVLAVGNKNRTVLHSFWSGTAFGHTWAHDMDLENVSIFRREFVFRAKNRTALRKPSVGLFDALGRSVVVESHIESKDKNSFRIFLKANESGQTLQEGSYKWVFYEQVNLGERPLIMQEIVFRAKATKDKFEAKTKPQILVFEKHAEIRWPLKGRSQALLWYGLDGEKLSCLGDTDAKGGFSSFLLSGANEELTTVHRFLLTPLEVNQSYRFVIRAKDPNDRLILSSGTFQAVKQPTPKIVINEVMANPKVHKSQKEAAGEFIELYNPGSAPAKFDSISLQIENLDGSERKICPLGPMEIGPSNYLVLVGNDFDEKHYPNLPFNQLYRLKTASICGELRNTEPKVLSLHHDKQIVASYFGHLWPGPDGRSIERLNRTDMDREDNYSFCSENDGPTPGLKNGSMNAF